MNQKDKNLHLGKTGIYLNKITTSDYVFNATETRTIQLLELIKNKIVPNSKITEEVLSEIKSFLQAHFVSLVTKLLETDKYENTKKDEERKFPSIKVGTPKNQNIDIARSYEITINNNIDSYCQDANFNLMLNFHLENLFSIPLFLSYLSMKDRQKASEITLATIREMQTEINELKEFKYYFTPATTQREIIIKEIIRARNELIDKNKKIPTTKEIAAIVRPERHKNTLNSELRTLGLKFDYEKGTFTDRKTNQEIKI